jgi:hypothetical protein
MIKCTRNYIILYDFARGALSRSWSMDLCTFKVLSRLNQNGGYPSDLIINAFLLSGANVAS